MLSYTNDNIDINNIKTYSLDAHVRIISTVILQLYAQIQKNLTSSEIKLRLLVANCVQLTFKIQSCGGL
jgi:hypothetical protein